MDIELSEDQQAFVRDAIKSGRMEHPEDASREALSLWKERERRRLEILASVDKAERSLAEGKGRVVDSAGAAAKLADDVKRRRVARLARETSAG